MVTYSKSTSKSYQDCELFPNFECTTNIIISFSQYLYVDIDYVTRVLVWRGLNGSLFDIDIH